MPLDPSVTAHEAANASTDVLVEHRLPRHQAEPEPVVDHGVAPADETGGARERAADILGGLRWPEGETESWPR